MPKLRHSFLYAFCSHIPLSPCVCLLSACIARQGSRSGTSQSRRRPSASTAAGLHAHGPTGTLQNYIRFKVFEARIYFMLHSVQIYHVPAPSSGQKTHNDLSPPGPSHVVTVCYSPRSLLHFIPSLLATPLAVSSSVLSTPLPPLLEGAHVEFRGRDEPENSIDNATSGRL